MFFAQIVLLAVLQGACELLPVSSSAHVIVAEKLMGLDPSSPDMTLVLVMLHTGTMFAVIVYFWEAWRRAYFRSRQVFLRSAALVVLATVATGIIGLALKAFIERIILKGTPDAEIELLFGNLGLIAAALAAVGFFIIGAGWLANRRSRRPGGEREVAVRDASLIGAVQGLCLPFRGFSRSGATISTGLVLGNARQAAEEFSFALAVVLTPPVILREVLRAVKTHPEVMRDHGALLHMALPSLVGMGAAFVAGLLALRWLSSWLEHGRWQYFGCYCLVASAVVFSLYLSGF